MTVFCQDKNNLINFGILISSIFSTQILSHSRDRVRDEEQLLDPDHAHPKPRPTALAVSSQSREQDLHRGAHPNHPAPGQARGQSSGAQSEVGSQQDFEF